MDNTKINVALIGSGVWSQGWHLKHLYSNPDVNLVAIVDKNITFSDQLAKKYLCLSFSSFDELINNCNIQLDGIIISTPHHNHFETALKSLKYNLHILLEKPMCTTIKESYLLKNALDQSNGSIIINHTANFRKPAILARKFLMENKIGGLNHIILHMASPLFYLFNDKQRATWNTGIGKANLNGFGWGQLSHILAWIFMTTELQPSEAFTFMNFSKQTGADISNAATIKCSNGCTISISGTCLLPGKDEDNIGKQIYIKIFGESGMLSYVGIDNDINSGDLIATINKKHSIIYKGFLFEDTDCNGIGPDSMQTWIKACKKEEYENYASINCGTKVVQVLESFYMSALTGKKIII
jgi:predicted dehydrogenase